jgi:hypothetical protein
MDCFAGSIVLCGMVEEWLQSLASSPARRRGKTRRAGTVRGFDGGTTLRRLLRPHPASHAAHCLHVAIIIGASLAPMIFLQLLKYVRRA